MNTFSLHLIFCYSFPSKLLCPKMHVVICLNIFKKYVWFMKFIYVPTLSKQIEDLLRFHHLIFRFYWKRSSTPFGLDPPSIKFPAHLLLPVSTFTVNTFGGSYKSNITNMPFHVFLVDLCTISQIFKTFSNGYSHNFSVLAFPLTSKQYMVSRILRYAE